LHGLKCQLHDDIATSINRMRALAQGVETMLAIERKRYAQRSIGKQIERRGPAHPGPFNRCLKQDFTVPLASFVWCHGHSGQLKPRRGFLEERTYANDLAGLDKTQDMPPLANDPVRI